LFIQGCGYTVSAYFLPDHLHSIHIETFQNKTDQHNLENGLRPQLITAFQNEGHLAITIPDQADTILSGQIIDYAREALRYHDDERIREYRLRITVNFKLYDKVKDEVVVQDNNFSGDTTFYLTGATAKSEAEALDECLADLAKRILNRIITLW
jgi:hypothetical protein